MKTQPCSKTIDKEFHAPHTYYWSGYDVRCPGYTPMRDAMSDEAETPEQFFGLDVVTKRPLFEGVSIMKDKDDVPEIKDCNMRLHEVDHATHDWSLLSGGVTYRCYGYDGEIERLLWEEEVIEFEVQHGTEALSLFLSGDWSVDRIAQKFNVSEKTVQKLIDDELTKPFWKDAQEEFERQHGNAISRALLWYDQLRPIYQDLILLVVVVIIFIILSFLIYGVAV